MNSDDYKRKSNEIMGVAQIHVVVATLIATVTFTAGFTLPGGFENDDNSPNKGMAILVKKPAFCAFVITDAIASVCSAGAVFTYFTMAMNHRSSIKLDMRVLQRIDMVATMLQLLSMLAVAIGFITGLYATLSHSVGLAASVCAIGSLSFLIYVLVFYLIYKGLSGHTSDP